MAFAAELVLKVEDYVKQYMSKYDASHDFAHIKRVVSRAHFIHARIIANATTKGQPVPQYDMTTITLSALLHDVGDRKYVDMEKEDPKTMINDLLLNLGADPGLASKVQTICSGVSHHEEIKDLQHVQNLIIQYPELAIVQDADRIDALGAIGIGRVFTYGGAKTLRPMLDSINVFDTKLLSLEPLMKTEPGREMAREAVKRLEIFRKWWIGEVVIEDGYTLRITQ
ncbi:HD domain-containing protein [Sclerotinia borealis F-4128]|uniref:HD domain-containing protein n=1 Tax=Sclerotinia borealis (strain F-4128) TaxID=1432307 RepID=W9CLA6_SCLBF|nr:HD domain-containing protein [Sclerotinia borealis F-4128]